MQGTGRRKTAHAPPTSEELIEVYQQTQRPEDFEQIVRRFAALVLSECRRVTGNSHDAEDASQLAFLALAIEIKSGTAIRSPGSWLARVARRQASKIVRARGRLRRREDAARRNELHVSNGESALDAAVTSGIVRDAIDRLPERYRLPVILHYFGGMSLERIASELKLKRPAVATRLHRGRKMLGDRLARHGMRLDNAALAGLLAVLVPTAVVTSVVAAARSISVSGATHASATTLGFSITETLRALAGIGLRRHMRVAIIAAALACTTSAMAWVIGPRVWSLDRLGELDPRPVIQKLLHLDTAPRLRVDSGTAPVGNVAPLLRVARAERGAGKRLVGSEAVDGGAGASISSAQAPVARAENAVVTVRPVSVGAMEKMAPWPAVSASQVQSGMARRNPPAPSAIINDRQTVNGSVEMGSLTLAPRMGDHAELRVAGEVMLTDPAGHVTVGEQGSGALYIGNESGPGEIRATPGMSVPFVVRGSPGARGVVQGWGTIATNGPLINNGQVIADGFFHYRDLDLSGASSISHSLPSPRGDGASGWFVQRGGKLKLPVLKIEPGTRTYTWGDSETTPTLELINSLRLTVHDQPAAADLSVALRTVALSDPLDLALPSDTSIIGLWQFNATATFDPRQLDVLVRYDERAAQKFFPGESTVQLLASRGGSWEMAGNASLDLRRHVVAGSFGGAVDYVAVAIPWSYTFREIRPSSLGGVSAVTPEPGMGVVLLAMAGGVMLGRRRR